MANLESKATTEFEWPKLLKRYRRKHTFAKLVIKRRLGKCGLRPFGSSKCTSKNFESLGTRIVKTKDLNPSSRTPLVEVLGRVKVWLDEERRNNNEVRTKHIYQRTIYELEFERDKQDVLKQHNAPEYMAFVHRAVSQKLRCLKVHGACTPQIKWFKNKVFRDIGAVAKTCQNKAQTSSSLDVHKLNATMQEGSHVRDQVSSYTGGDKYRVTLVNASVIKRWFDPDKFLDDEIEVVYKDLADSP